MRILTIWRQRLRHAFAALLTLAFYTLAATPAFANTCSPAATQGTAPPEWQTYCWLDFTGYNDATARSVGGQPFSFTLTDGSTMTLTLRTTGPAGALADRPAPSWTGAAVGNSAFLGIPGRPILYTITSGATVTVQLSSIAITPPPGAGATTAYMFIGADAESTDGAETLSFTTNGGNWTILDQVNPITGSQYPTITNTGTTFTESGAGLTGNVGGYIVGSTTPTTVSSTLAGSGLQGAMFAVRFASLKLTKNIVSSRIDAADQFTYRVASTGTGAILTAGTTSGTGNGPFTSATVSLASGLPLTLSEVMAAGSVSPLASYSGRLTCTNTNTSSTTPLPNNLATTSYSFGPLAYGDAVNCNFINTPLPRLRLTKALGGTRVFTGDQFIMNINTGATTVATTTTTGTGATVGNANTPTALVTVGAAYSFNEVASGTTNLTYYMSTMACTNLYTGSTTPLPSTVGGTVTPALGDNIRCTITNNPKPNAASLTISKTTTLISDPVNGATNPKMIPGAIVEYAITVTNAGTGPVDANTITIIDPIPTTLGTYVLGTAVTYSDTLGGGSAISCPYATCVSWTKTAGGATGWGAALTPDGAGYDDAITGVRIIPSGTMPAATAGGQPSFTIRFRTRIK
jgi:Surface adhesin CshA non-repetitive domain 2